MQELIERLKSQGLSEDHANKAIEVIKDFVKEKFPMFSEAIDDLFDKYSSNDNDYLQQ